MYSYADQSLLGLYYKLHGVHRPTFMKKSVIKRRKRVIPTVQDTQGDDYSSSGEQGASPPPAAPAKLAARPEQPAAPEPMDIDMERGTVNSDGSVNLGLRRRADHALTLVPEAALRQSQQQQQQISPRMAGGTDLTHYHTSSSSHQSHQSHSPNQHQHQRMDMSNSFNDDNRLPPLTAFPSIHSSVERQTSMSPASFLSPSRKRSFSSSENDHSGQPPHSSHSGHGDNNHVYGSISSNSAGVGGSSNSNNHSSMSHESMAKRMSSIKSLLNAPSYEDDDSLGSMAGPYPGIGGGLSSATQNNAGMTSSDNNGHLRQEKRAALQREAERMRQMLAEKERELAELE